LRPRALVALGLTTFGLACAPAISTAATGGASMPSSSSSAKTSGDETQAPAPQDQAGGAAFGAIPKLLRPTVPGDVGVIRDDIAYAPENAPLAVQQAIWAANKLRNKPYIYGGGHRSFRSRGYDCSGTVSFALHGGGLLDSPLDSSGFMKWGLPGTGRWITTYANPNHMYVIIAGLRLDTGSGGEKGPRWRTTPRPPGNFIARHPAGL